MKRQTPKNTYKYFEYIIACALQKELIGVRVHFINKCFFRKARDTEKHNVSRISDVQVEIMNWECCTNNGIDFIVRIKTDKVNEFKYLDFDDVYWNW